MSRNSLKIIALCALLAACAAFYVPLRFHSLMGDDFLPHLMRHAAGSEPVLKTVFLKNYIEIYRPLNLLFVLERARLFGVDAELYFFGNLFLLWIEVAVVFLLLERLSGSTLLASILALFVAFHRSLHYSVLVRTGEVDLLPNILWAAVLWLFVLYLEDRRPSRYLAMAAGYLVLLFTRENYLFAAPALAASAFWVGPEGSPLRNARARKAWLLAGGVALAAGAYLVARRLVLGPSMMQVPGAQLAPGVDALGAYGIFFLDLFTIYLNVDSFSGIWYGAVPVKLWAVQIAFLGLVAAAIVLFFRDARIDRGAKESGAFLGLIALLMLVPGSLIQKMDVRYVAPSLVSCAAVLALALPLLLRTGALRAGALAALAAFAAVTSLYYRAHSEELFFFKATRIAESFKRLTIDRYGSSLRDYHVYVPDDPEVYWPLGNTAFYPHPFLAVYTGDWSFYPRFYRNLSEADSPAEKKIVLGFTWRQFYDVTPAMFEEARRKKGRVRCDLVADFAAGSIIPPTYAETNTGKGALVVPFDGSDETELPEKALAVISGFDYRYPSVHVEEGDELDFAVRIPHPISDGAGFRIRFAGQPVYEDATLKYSKSWARRRLDLSRFAGRTGDLDVEVWSPSGDATADWVIFKELEVLSARPVTADGRSSR